MKRTYHKSITKENLNESDAFKLRKMGLPFKKANLKLKSFDFNLSSCKGHGIGMSTDSGGFSIVNTKTWKSIHIGRPGIVRLEAEENECKMESCLVFWGFMDYLCYLAIQQDNPMSLPFDENNDVIIIQTSANFFYLVAMTDLYERVYLFLPRCECGQVISKTIQLRRPSHVANYDIFYGEYKSLFDYFVKRKGR